MMGWVKDPEGNKCYSQIAEKLAEKRDKPYSVMMLWILRKISFSMMKSTLYICVEVHGSSLRKKDITSRNQQATGILKQHNVINKRKVMKNITPKQVK